MSQRKGKPHTQPRHASMPEKRGPRSISLSEPQRAWQSHPGVYQGEAKGASLWLSEAAGLFLVRGGELVTGQPDMPHPWAYSSLEKRCAPFRPEQFSIYRHTHQKHHRRLADQSHGCRQLALVTSTVVASVFFAVLHKAQFPNCPLTDLAQ